MAHDWHARARYDLDAFHSGARLGARPPMDAGSLGKCWPWSRLSLRRETFGDRLNAGVAVAIAHRAGLVIELDAERVFGLDPKPAPCGLVNNTCRGSGRYGPRQATVASLAVHYRFKGTRVQPFLVAGIGMLRTASLHTTMHTSTSPAVMVESESRDRGFGPDLGAGLRLMLAPHVVISPEIRWLDASLLSRENLAITRLGIRTTYSW